MRRRRYLIQNAVASPAQNLRYNHGHYTAVQHFQQEAATGTDSGAFTLTIGTGSGTVTGDYSAAGIPGGHTGLVGAYGPRDTTGPASTNTKGLVMRYYWNQIETSQDVYDFTRMDAELATCVALGCQLIVVVEARTFKVADQPAPAYLQVLPYSFQYSLSGGGNQISRWDTYVTSRFLKLVRKIIDRYDVNTHFEGIATQETACSMTPAEQVSVGYTSDKYLTALKAEVDAIVDYAVYSRHFAYHNFMDVEGSDTQAIVDAKIDAYCTYAAGKKAIVGGPDALPRNSGLHNRVYPRYADTSILKGRTATFISAQHDSHTQTTDTMLQLWQWASNQLTINATRLYVDYFFWDFWSGLSPNNWNPQDRDVIAAHPSSDNWHTYNP